MITFLSLFINSQNKFISWLQLHYVGLICGYITFMKKDRLHGWPKEIVCD
jgi:hypothetical protein